jgi:hypothetical protein
LAGGKSKVTLVKGLAGGERQFASLSHLPLHPPAECTVETGFCFRLGHLLGVWSVCCHCTVGPSRLGCFVGGKSNFLAAFAPGPGMGASAFSRHGNAIPSGSIFTHLRASRQMTPPPLVQQDKSRDCVDVELFHKRLCARLHSHLVVSIVPY